MHWLRRIVGILLAGLLLLAIGYGFVPQPPLVAVAPVARAPLQVTVREEGRTRVKDRYVISAPVPGFGQRVELEVGDTVAPDQRLLELEPLRSSLLDPRTRAEAEARVSVAEANLKATEERALATASEAKLAESELSRLQSLYADGTATRQNVERAEADARGKLALQRSAEFAVDVARHELAAARAALQHSQSGGPDGSPEVVPVTTPVAGKVLRVLHESEGVIQAGQPILEVGDPSALEVEAEVLSDDAVQIQPGMRVVLDRWGGAPLEAVVRVIEPVGFTKVSALGVEEQRVLVIVDITSPREAWQSLGDGYRVEATFVLWEGDDVLQVPNSALFRGDAGWQVFVHQDGVAQLREVTLGKRGGLRSQVTAGLTAGERVITHPDDSVSPGVAVRLRD